MSLVLSMLVWLLLLILFLGPMLSRSLVLRAWVGRIQASQVRDDPETLAAKSSMYLFSPMWPD